MYNQALLEKLTKNDSSSVYHYKEKCYDRFKALDYPKWKRLKIEHLEVPEYRSFSNLMVHSTKRDGMMVDPLSKMMDKDFISTYLNIEHPYGISEKYKTLTEVFANTGVVIQAEKGCQSHEDIYIKYTMDDQNPLLLDHNLIVANENSQLNVIIDYRGNGVKDFHNGVTKIIAKAKAKVRLIVLQNLSEHAVHFHSVVALLERDADVSYYTIDFGGQTIATDYTAYLKEIGSQSHAQGIYLGDKDMKLDIGYRMFHQDRRTISYIEARGALLDQARKVFRGDLKFERGASRSKGVEKEYVMLLDPHVKSDAIPALLCDEDDVEGEHAASAGQVDEDQLFYIMSRGFSEKEAKRLIVHASFTPVLNQLPSDLREKAEVELSRRMTHVS